MFVFLTIFFDPEGNAIALRRGEIERGETVKSVIAMRGRLTEPKRRVLEIDGLARIPRSWMHMPARRRSQAGR